MEDSTPGHFRIVVSGFFGNVIIVTKDETDKDAEATFASLRREYEKLGFSECPCDHPNLHQSIRQRLLSTQVGNWCWQICCRWDQDFYDNLARKQVRSQFKWAWRIQLESKNGTDGRLLHTVLSLCSTCYRLRMLFRNMVHTDYFAYSKKPSLSRTKRVDITYDESTKKNMMGKHQFFEYFTNCTPKDLHIEQIPIPISSWKHLISHKLKDLHVSGYTETEFRSVLQALEQRRVHLYQLWINESDVPEECYSPVLLHTILILDHMTEVQTHKALSSLDRTTRYLAMINPAMAATEEIMDFIAGTCPHLWILTVCEWKTFGSHHINCLSKAFEVRNRKKLWALAVDASCNLDFKKYGARFFLEKYERTFTRKICLCRHLTPEFASHTICSFNPLSMLTSILHAVL